MTNTPFLDKLALVLLVKYSEKLSNTIVVLPNKRAKIFLIEALKNQVETNVLSPNIVSIEELIQDIASIRSIDSIELLFEFYEVYLSITEKSNQQSFELLPIGPKHFCKISTKLIAIYWSLIMFFLI